MNKTSGAITKNEKKVSSFISDRKRFEAAIPLRDSFRFVHEPLGTENAELFVGRNDEMETLVERILFSDGGSFLVTGYRGVGKTSFINQVVRKLADSVGWAKDFLGETEIVDIYMNVARPLQPSEIMHHIIRRMYERLLEKDIYTRLSPELKEAVETAYNRTSLNMARKLSESREQTLGANEINFGGFLLKAGIKIPWSRKYSRTQNYEMSYLGYDDKAAEHDIISISKKLSHGYFRRLSFWQSLKSFFSEDKGEKIRLKIIFVFDELDKLEEYKAQIGGEDRPAIEEILGALKNLFTTSGVTFIFVAGKDLQERWLEDVGKGDSVYESVFSYDKYLPCLWTDGDAVCENLIENFSALSTYENGIVGEFQKYLTYKGRGIPRRIVRTFNEYVKWSEEKPVAAFTAQNIRNIRFFSSLQELIAANEKQLFGNSHEETAGTKSDKRRLGVYYIFDWIFRQEQPEFSTEDVLKASRKFSKKIALAEEVAPHVIEKIISVLEKSDYIEKIHRTIRFAAGNANRNLSPAAPDGRDFYRISPRRLGEIAGIAAAEFSEIKSDEVNFSSSENYANPAERQPTAVGKYKITEKIGGGGMGAVYKAIDLFGRHAAVKISLDDANLELRDRFKREARIMETLVHPNIVKFYEFGEFGERVYIAMEYLSGMTLEKVLNVKNRLDTAIALAVANAVAEVFDYVHQKGYVRNDIKPSNIMLTDDERICVFDFGSSKPISAESQTSEDFQTMNTAIIGTPLFMAPECFDDPSKTDARSDVYSLGIVMYKMLTGEYPFAQTGMYDLMKAKTENRITAPSNLVSSIPPVFDDVVLKCLNFAPEERFQTMGKFSEALKQITTDFGRIDLVTLIGEARSEIRQAVKAEEMRTIINYPTVDPPTLSSPTPVSQEVFVSPGHQSLPDMIEDTEEKLQDASTELVENPAETIEAFDENFPFLKTVAANKYSNLSGRIFSLEKKLTLGRSHSNDVVLDDRFASRYQAVIDFNTERDEWFIEDLNSATGTFINGERILSRHYLNDQDTIRIGETEFIFQKNKTFRQTNERESHRLP